VLSPAEQQKVAQTSEHDARVVSNTQLEQQLAGQPQKTKDEIVKINTQARHIALQVALLIPILAGLTGLGISLRMMRLPDPAQSTSVPHSSNPPSLRRSSQPLGFEDSSCGLEDSTLPETQLPLVCSAAVPPA
jgi:hypothetical protein